MTSERWRQVEALYHAAVECDPGLSLPRWRKQKSGESVLDRLLDDTHRADSTSFDATRMGTSYLLGLCRFLLLCAAATGILGAAEPPVFRAGAARVEITPAADAALLMSGYANRTQ